MDIPLLNDKKYVFDQDNGHFVSEAAARLAEMLNAFDDTLLLQYIPEHERGPADRAQPFRVIQDAPGHEPYIVMYLRSDELDFRVLARLAEARSFGKNGAQSLAQRLQIEEEARQLEQWKKDQELREEAMDKAKFLVRTPLHTVNFEGKKLHL